MLDDTISDADEGALEGIRERIFALPLLPQRNVVEAFQALDATIGRSIEQLLGASNFVERYIAGVIADVAASVTHGRTIYGGARPSSESAPRGPARVVFRRASDIRFLERAINIMHALAHYRDDVRDPHKVKVRRLLRDVRFVRLVYEEILQTFRHATEHYEALTFEGAAQYREFHAAVEPHAAREAATRYSEYEGKLQAVESVVGVERQRLYHLCRAIRRTYREQLQHRDRIYEPYLRIAYKEAKKHATNDQQTLENFQNGAQGLLRAISCYDLAKNVSFSSYAHWWVRQAILFHIKDSSNFVKLPVTTWQTYTAVEKRRAKLATRDGDDSIEALARDTGHSVDKLKEVYDSVRSSHVHSLDYEVDDSGKMLLIDVLPDERDREALRAEQLRDNVRERLHALDPEQRWLVMLHYGLLDLLTDKAPLRSQDVERERARQRAH